MRSIGYVVHVKTPGTLGGETRSYQMAQALAMAGLDLHLYGQVDCSFDWAEGVHPHQLKSPVPRAVAQLARDFSRNNVGTVIERYQFPPFNVGSHSQRIRSRPLVFEIHGFPIDEYALVAEGQDSNVDPLIRLLMRFPRSIWEGLQANLLKDASHIIVTSHGTSDILVSLGVAMERISVVYNCVDPMLFDPDSRRANSCRAAFGLPSSGEVILYAGSLFHEELLTVVDAVSTVIRVLPSAHLLCLGTGSTDALKARAREAGLSEEQFLILPPIPHYRMPDLLAAVDVVLAPYSLASQRFDKAFHYSPLKVMEALAMLKVVVTVDAVELQSVFGALSSVLFAKSGHSQSWAEGILRALEMRGSPDLVQGRSFIMDGYRWQDAAQKYLAILQDTEQGLH